MGPYTAILTSSHEEKWLRLFCKVFTKLSGNEFSSNACFKVPIASIMSIQIPRSFCRAAILRFCQHSGKQDSRKGRYWAIWKWNKRLAFGDGLFTRCWFQTFFIFTPIWGRFPFWLIFFKGVETTNQFGVWGWFVYHSSFVLAPVDLCQQNASGHHITIRMRTGNQDVVMTSQIIGLTLSNVMINRCW